ncbi:MAG: hypothetical protein ACK4JC_03600 [Silanimonas lenta]
MSAISLLRYILLSVCGGAFFAGAVAIALCLPKCYGVAEMIHGLVAGACAALGILFFLMLRHPSVAKDRRRAAREAKLQWWLIGISLLAFLAMIAFL